MGARSPQHEIRNDVREHRSPSYDIAPLFVNRWSSRSMTGESVDENQFMALFEAAKWAPSAYNNQPWRFLYATRTSDYWNVYFDLLSEENKTWAKRAAGLVVIVSKTTFDYNGEPSRTHSFNTGAAWQNLALEGVRRGLVVHGIGGFDYERAADVLSVPSNYAIEAMAAIGVRASPNILSEEMQERETPSNRKPLSDIVIDGAFDDIEDGGDE
ncbi:nitroreductase family protein [Halocatena marina]|uniref:Nitroreductase family protein n=1 Tax=Halocatena marina TaxID=2934937 RepID=A0ABD5YWJ8_9EURY|nr:nitroreductase family protein [Halocatena marina]